MATEDGGMANTGTAGAGGAPAPDAPGRGEGMPGNATAQSQQAGAGPNYGAGGIIRGMLIRLLQMLRIVPVQKVDPDTKELLDQNKRMERELAALRQGRQPGEPGREHERPDANGPEAGQPGREGGDNPHNPAAPGGLEASGGPAAGGGGAVEAAGMDDAGEMALAQADGEGILRSMQANDGRVTLTPGEYVAAARQAPWAGRPAEPERPGRGRGRGQPALGRDRERLPPAAGGGYAPPSL